MNYKNLRQISSIIILPPRVNIYFSYGSLRYYRAALFPFGAQLFL